MPRVAALLKCTATYSRTPRARVPKLAPGGNDGNAYQKNLFKLNHLTLGKLCTLTAPTSGAACEPGEATTCTLSEGHRLGATRRSSGACSART